MAEMQVDGDEGEGVAAAHSGYRSTRERPKSDSETLKPSERGRGEVLLVRVVREGCSPQVHSHGHSLARRSLCCAREDCRSFARPPSTALAGPARLFCSPPPLDATHLSR